MFVCCSVNKLVRLLLVILHHAKINVWTFLNPHRSWNLNSIPDFSLQLIWHIFSFFLVECAGELHIFILRENWHIFSWFSENLMHFLIELIITFGDHMLAFLWSLEKKFSILGFTVPD